MIWDMDGTLVNSEPEILATTQKALATMGLTVADAQEPLRIGPPLPVMLRTSFSEEVLSNDNLDEVVGAFRKIYDASEFKETKPFDGIDEIIRCGGFVHHVITNKPDFATRRIIEKKGWTPFIKDVLSPNTLIQKVGRQMKKRELFQYFRNLNPDIVMVGIGDMASDANCAKAIGIHAIGVLWGTGTLAELEDAGCYAIVKDATELREELSKLVN